MAKDKIASLEELKEVFSQDLTSKNRLGLSLVNEAIFMQQTLRELKEKVRENGVVTEMCQGNYYIERENPALKSYATIIKNYNSTLKQINDLLPIEEEKEEDLFESFE